MLRLLYTCLEIMWFRRGPADMPGSVRWAAAVLILYAAVGLLMSMVSLPPVQAGMQVALDVVILVAFAQIALRWRNRSARLPQTLTALAGTGILFTVLALPAMVSLENLNSSGGDAGVPALLLLVLIFWNLAVIVHIMRQALVVPLGTAMMVSLGYLVVSMVTISMIFPPVA